MNAKQMIKEYLYNNGYDGLCSIEGECGCKLDDLAPCYHLSIDDCQAGHLVDCDPETCPVDGDCEWHIEVTGKQ